ncbi:hypothetical protein NQZ79_g2804 [Umbelopsis isabellina]|nr:hypothetical protein NQZ79_g2804 [Umbelopsis isabellina]
MSKKLPDRGKTTKAAYDPEAQQKHLRRHLESLERDNHQPLDDVEGLVSVALAHIDDDGSGRKRQKVSRANPFSTRQNLNTLILEAVSRQFSKQTFRKRRSCQKTHISIKETGFVTS